MKQIKFKLPQTIIKCISKYNQNKLLSENEVSFWIVFVDYNILLRWISIISVSFLNDSRLLSTFILHCRNPLLITYKHSFLLPDNATTNLLRNIFKINMEIVKSTTVTYRRINSKVLDHPKNRFTILKQNLIKKHLKYDSSN